MLGVWSRTTAACGEKDAGRGLDGCVIAGPPRVDRKRELSWHPSADTKQGVLPRRRAGRRRRDSATIHRGAAERWSMSWTMFAPTTRLRRVYQPAASPERRERRRNFFPRRRAAGGA